MFCHDLTYVVEQICSYFTKYVYVLLYCTYCMYWYHYILLPCFEVFISLLGFFFPFLSQLLSVVPLRHMSIVTPTHAPL